MFPLDRLRKNNHYEYADITKQFVVEFRKQNISLFFSFCLLEVYITA